MSRMQTKTTKKPEHVLLFGKELNHQVIMSFNESESESIY